MISKDVTLFKPQTVEEILACHKIKLKEVKMVDDNGPLFICPLEKTKVVTERLKDILLELRSK
jgi:hypothetical protein